MAEQPDAEKQATSPEERVTKVLKFLPVMTAMQLLFAVPTFILSLVVAYATYVQADATRAIQAASVWPRLQISLLMQNLVDNDETSRMAVMLSSTGNGPATVRQISVVVDGEEMESWAETVRKLGQKDEQFDSTWVFGSSILPGESRDLLVIFGPPAIPAAEAYSQDRLEISVCYCSIYGDCWIAKSKEPIEEPVPICKAVSDPKSVQF